MQINTSKSVLRDSFRLIRNRAKSEEKDKLIYERFIKTSSYRKADTLFIYCSVRNEVDTVKIITSAFSDGKRVALPRCTDKNGSMDFYFIENLTDSLKDGKFSLKEPDADKCSKAVFESCNLCVAPGLAFDRYGNRLGYGGGYYDRFLSSFNGEIIGLCYEECFCEKLPDEKHDIKVNMIITDKKIYEIK